MRLKYAIASGSIISHIFNSEKLIYIIIQLQSIILKENFGILYECKTMINFSAQYATKRKDYGF